MSKKILIIDDEPDVMMVLRYRLKAQGIEVMTAEDGPKGIEMAKEMLPDLILLDFRLANMSGKEVADEIHSCEKIADIPIILITASCEHIADIAEECKAVDFISKPIEAEDLLEKISKYISIK